MGGDLMYCLYETKTGAICGMSTSQPAQFAGYSSIAVPVAPDMDASYVTGGALKARDAITWDAIPADAYVSINDAAPVKGVALPTTPGVWRYRATGRYRGERTFTIQTPQEIEAKLIADIKARAETEKMRVLSSGGAKKTEYADKYREVVAWDTLAGTAAQILIAFNALPTQQRALRFAYAIADAAAFGDTPADAIARFKAGIAKSTSAATLAAIEARACAVIKAATTVAAKQAAAAAVTWPA